MALAEQKRSEGLSQDVDSVRAPSSQFFEFTEAPVYFFSEKCRKQKPVVFQVVPFFSSFFKLFPSPRYPSLLLPLSFAQVATWLARMPRSDGEKGGKRRHVIITCGEKPTVVASTWKGYGVKVQRFPVPPVRELETGFGAEMERLDMFGR